MRGKIIVTGASGVLGAAVVEHLAATGAEIAAIDLAPAREGGAATVARGGVDLTSPEAVERAYAEVASALGGLTGLVNIAGGFVWELFDGGAIENFDKMYNLNVRSAAVSSRAALAHMKPGGSIVNVGALAAANNPGAGMAAYAASKAGVHALTQSLADECKGHGVRVNAILPTIFDTPRNRADMPDADVSTWVKPEAAAKLIAFLLSEDSSVVTGALIPVTLPG